MDTEFSDETTSSDVFIFRGGNLALDLVNTEIAVRGKRKELLNSPGDLADWWVAVRQHYPASEVANEGPDKFNEDLLAATKQLRASLRNLFDSLVKKKSIDLLNLEEINRVLSLGKHALLLKPGNEIKGIYRVEKSPLLFEVALEAFKVITEYEPERLHKCQNDRCILYFYDTTKSATRHWCSLGCMNRARSRQNYLKARGGRAAGPEMEEGKATC